MSFLKMSWIEKLKLELETWRLIIKHLRERRSKKKK